MPRAGVASRGIAPSAVKLRVIRGEASRLTNNQGAGKQTGPALYCRARSRIASVRVAAYPSRVDPETDRNKPASQRASDTGTEAKTPPRASIATPGATIKVFRTIPTI